MQPLQEQDYFLPDDWCKICGSLAFISCLNANLRNAGVAEVTIRELALEASSARIVVLYG
jgi:hypothetical protein